MSKIEVNTIDTIAGSTTLTLGSTNATLITLDSGAQFSNVSGQNYPAFAARISGGTQDIGSTGVFTKIEFDTEILDTNSCYDPTTNYRFTPTVAGKYFVYVELYMNSSASSNTLTNLVTGIYKNGSPVNYNGRFKGSALETLGMSINEIVDMNGTTDYLEAFGYSNNNTSGTAKIQGGTEYSKFGAFRIGA